MSYIAHDSLELLIQIFDRQTPNIPSLENGWIYGIPASELSRMLEGYEFSDIERWVEIVGYSSCVEYMVKAELEYVDVEKTDSSGTMYLRNLFIPDPYVSAKVAAVYRIKEEDLFLEIGRRLNLSGLVDNPAICMVPNHVWILGAVSLGANIKHQIYLVRSLEREKNEIIRALGVLGARGIVLLTGTRNDDLLRWPRSIESQRLVDVLSGEGLRFEFSLPWMNSAAAVTDIPVNMLEEVKEFRSIPEETLGRVEQRAEVKNEKGDVLVAYDWGNYILSIPGKPDWKLEGGVRQAAIVKFIFDNAKKGRWTVQHKDLMTATKPRFGGARHISSVFSENRVWDNYIVKVRRGVWGFDLVS